MKNNFRKIVFQDWIFNVDKKLTQEEYSKIKNSSAETCGCENCLKYIASRKKIFPNEILVLFEQLGINPNKEIEVSYLGDIDGYKHYFTGWFHFVGSFIGVECKIPTSKDGFTLEFTKVNENFEIGFTRGNQLSQFKTDEDLVQLEFACKIS